MKIYLCTVLSSLGFLMDLPEFADKEELIGEATTAEEANTIVTEYFKKHHYHCKTVQKEQKDEENKLVMSLDGSIEKIELRYAPEEKEDVLTYPYDFTYEEPEPEPPCYEFKNEHAYRLVSVTDKEGKDKSAQSFYGGYIGCVSERFRFDAKPSYGNLYRLLIEFTQNADGNWTEKCVHTSVVHRVEETQDGFKIITDNSVYIFEKAEMQPVSYRDEANLIELYLSGEYEYVFCKGFYYDEKKVPHELTHNVHVGTIQDSVLISPKENDLGLFYVCRYFPYDYEIEFYDTIYGQQEYRVPILIHNTGNYDLLVRFEFDERRWEIKPGECERILPDSSKYGAKRFEQMITAWDDSSKEE